MKLPIWAKDREGNYKVFPYELLETFSDRSMGITWVAAYDPQVQELFLQFKGHFIMRGEIRKEGSNVKWPSADACCILRGTIKGAG